MKGAEPGSPALALPDAYRSTGREKPSETRPDRRPALLGGLIVLLAALTVAVQLGGLTWLDQLGISHLMPWFEPGSTASHGSAGLWRPFSADTAFGAKLLDLLTYPCSVLISGLVVASAAAVAWRRRLHALAAAIPAAWVVGNAVEVIGKHVITKPALHGVAHGVRIRVESFDPSFPSGHMLRGTLLAATVALLWPRVGLWVALWALTVGPSLVLQSAHVPSDVVGGLLLGCAVSLGAWLVVERVSGPIRVPAVEAGETRR